MSGITSQDMSAVATELRAAIDAHDKLCVTIGGKPPRVHPDTGEVIERGVEGLEARHKRAYLTAHANSTAQFPKRKVAEHETAAEQGSLIEWADLNAAQYGLKACKERMHSLRQVLSAFQTQARIESEIGGAIPDRPFGERRSA